MKSNFVFFVLEESGKPHSDFCKNLVSMVYIYIYKFIRKVARHLFHS